MAFLINENFKAPLSNAIATEYNKLIETVSKVPDQLRLVKQIQGTGGLVSVSDIIAYQIGWAELVIYWYTSGLKKQVPEMPGQGFLKWDYVGLAKHFYKKYHYDSSSEQEKQFYSLVAVILAIVEKEYVTGNLDKTGIWLWCRLPSGKEWPLSKWIKVNTLAPYKRATTLIKKFLKIIDLQN